MYLFSAETRSGTSSTGCSLQASRFDRERLLWFTVGWWIYW